jgi:hypothetical protein
MGTGKRCFYCTSNWPGFASVCHCRLFWTRPKKGDLRDSLGQRSTIATSRGPRRTCAPTGHTACAVVAKRYLTSVLPSTRWVDDWTPHGKSIAVSWLVWKCHGNRFHGVDKPPFNSGALSFRIAADQVNLHPSVFTSTSLEWTRKVAPSDIPVCQTLQEQRAPRRLVA